MKSVYASHPRDWRTNLYVYPVISRRSRGLSIGVNLNPDKACNFDCIYCQVDRHTPPHTRRVDVTVLRGELEHMLSLAACGSIYQNVHFGAVPEGLRRLNDIAFSGDGEPTTCPEFLQAVQLCAELKDRSALDPVKIVLITDACYLTKPPVVRALEIMDGHNGEIWAKLDAGTEAYYQLINRPNHPLRHVLENILAAARVRPIVIQALFMRVHGVPPSGEELSAFCDRLNETVAGGGRIKLVQVYTIARPPTESFVTPLSDEEVDSFCRVVTGRTQLPVEPFYGAS